MAASTFTPQGPSEISATREGVHALKLAGLPYDDPRSDAGCASAFWRWAACRRPTATSRSTSACSDLYPREHTPSIPPEGMLLGKLIYEMSSWTRAIVIPLSIVHAMNPQRPVPAGFTLEGTVRRRACR